MPSGLPKRLVDRFVSGFIAADLLLPVISLGLWHATMPAATMPKATINKYSYPFPAKSEIWFAG